MDDREWLAERFAEHRPHLKGVAYRMLGSLVEADDALQDAWLRVSRSGADGVENIRGWLTTIVARVCLNMLRARKLRREEPIEAEVPDPVISPSDGVDPEQQIMLADAVGLALQVVLETLRPAERLAFVLHDMFDMSFDEIAPMADCSVEAARQMASRARRRVRGLAPVPDAELSAQQSVVDAFLAAAHEGDLAGLVAVLHPDAVLRADGLPLRPDQRILVRGAANVARSAVLGARDHPSAELQPALVNGAAGLIMMEYGEPLGVWGITVAQGKIVEIDVVANPERLRQLGIGGRAS
jgi:RNA polymerase sigma-70 factor (ECF subfamily)